MLIKKINIKDTPFSSELVRDYIESEKLNSFFSYKNQLDNYKKIIKKRSSFPLKKRDLLYNVLNSQYNGISDIGSVLDSIEKLKNKNTFTVTTGHQLCLNTGPLYFIYKILHTIKLCVELSKTYKEFNFIPVFWMASEDHDFEEIKSFETYSNKYQIASNDDDSCTGKIKPLHVTKILEEINKNFDGKPFKNDIYDLFASSYSKNLSLAESTRKIVHTLFKDYGLVIIDADDKQFKKSFKNYFIDEAENFSTNSFVSETIKKLTKLYRNKIKIQVNPRDLNLFLIKHKKRYRLKFSNGKYHLVGSNISYKKDEIINKIKNNSEELSPNVILRPLYQEYLLPNLSYVGGNAEISYWLQLKSLFNYHKISFPILVVRNSFILLNRREVESIKKYNMDITDFLDSRDSFLRKIVKNNIENDISLENEKNIIKNLNEDLIKKIADIDANLKTSIKSIEAKQISLMNLLEKKIIKSQKVKVKNIINTLEKIYNKIYPDGLFQERKINFSEFYSYKGKELIDIIYQSTSPFDNSINIVEI